MSAPLSPGPARRDAPQRPDAKTWLRLLYLPWAALVFLPVALVTMVLFGSAAALASFISPSVAWRIGWAWCRLVCAINFTRVELRGAQHIERYPSVMIMLNHQSNDAALPVRQVALSA